MSTAAPDGAATRGTRSTGCRTDARCRSASDRAWTSRGRPAAGYYTKRTAEAWLRDLLDEARRGTLPGMVRTGATFADAAAEYLRWVEHDRARKPSTVRDYQSIINAHLLPAFGARRLEDITTDGIERWAARLTAGGRMNNRTKLKVLSVLHGVMGRARRVWKLPRNPVTDVEKPIQTHRTDIDVFHPKTSWRSCAPPAPSTTGRST
jgi:integrase